MQFPRDERCAQIAASLPFCASGWVATGTATNRGHPGRGGDQQNGYFKSEIISTWFPLLQLHQGCSHWRHLPTCLDLRLGDSGRGRAQWISKTLAQLGRYKHQRRAVQLCLSTEVTAAVVLHLSNLHEAYRRYTAPRCLLQARWPLKWTIKDASPCRISWTPGAIQTVPLHSKNGCISTSVPDQNCGNLSPYVCHDIP